MTNRQTVNFTKCCKQEPTRSYLEILFEIFFVSVIVQTWKCVQVLVRSVCQCRLILIKTGTPRQVFVTSHKSVIQIRSVTLKLLHIETEGHRNFSRHSVSRRLKPCFGGTVRRSDCSWQRTAPLCGILAFWHRNYFFNFSTPI